MGWLVVVLVGWFAVALSEAMRRCPGFRLGLFGAIKAVAQVVNVWASRMANAINAIGNAIKAVGGAAQNVAIWAERRRVVAERDADGEIELA